MVYKSEITRAIRSKDYREMIRAGQLAAHLPSRVDKRRKGLLKEFDRLWKAIKKMEKGFGPPFSDMIRNVLTRGQIREMRRELRDASSFLENEMWSSGMGDKLRDYLRCIEEGTENSEGESSGDWEPREKYLIEVAVALGELQKKFNGPLADTHRLMKPDDLCAAYPNLNFLNSYALTIDDAKVPKRFIFAGMNTLIADPLEFANVFESEDELACELRSKAVFMTKLMNGSYEICEKKPFIAVLPTFLRWGRPISHDEGLPDDVRSLDASAFADSGSLMFLPLTDDMSSAIQNKVEEVLKNNGRVGIRLPAGIWNFYYEEFAKPPDQFSDSSATYRRIVMTKLTQQPFSNEFGPVFN